MPRRNNLPRYRVSDVSAAVFPAPSPIGPRNRLEVTLFLGAAAHAIVILGVGFGLHDAPPPAPLTKMDVVLVQQRSQEKTPEEADFLAQANRQGGGDQEQAKRPASPPSRPLPAPRQRPNPNPSAARPAESRTPSRQELLTTRAAPRRVESAPEAPKTTPTLDTPPRPQTILEMARANPEWAERLESGARRLRHKYIVAATREDISATYADAWRRKIMRLGNLNYPDEAKRRNLSGELLLDVALSSDGALYGIKVLKSSGHQVLDDGALRIVRLAAPFAPFPRELREQTEILHIVRTWKFDSDYRLTSR